MSKRINTSTSNGILQNSGIHGVFGSIVNCNSNDQSTYCKFVKFFNIFFMILILLIVLYFIYSYFKN